MLVLKQFVQYENVVMHIQKCIVCHTDTTLNSFFCIVCVHPCVCVCVCVHLCVRNSIVTTRAHTHTPVEP